MSSPHPVARASGQRLTPPRSWPSLPPLPSPWRWVAGIAAALLLLAVGAIAAAWLDTPAPSALRARIEARLPAGAGTVPLRRISPAMRDAMVAAEDEHFYRNDGVDFDGLGRALAYDASHLTASQGASTITEQLAAILYLDPDDASPWEKLREAALALRLESRYSKPRILDAYLNSVYFGAGATGIGAASRRYFAVPPSGLSLAQASLIAGLPQGPSLYDPLSHPRAARARQVEVMRSMVRNGLVSGARGRRVLARPLRLARGGSLAPVRLTSLASGPAFVAGELWAGLTILAAGVIAGVLARREGWSRLAVTGAGVVALGGALLAAGSVRVL